MFRALTYCGSLKCMEVFQIRCIVSGVPTIRILVLCGLYWVPRVLGSYHIHPSLHFMFMHVSFDSRSFQSFSVTCNS